MIPGPELVAEFVLGLGGALFAANLWVLLRPIVTRPRRGQPIPRPRSYQRVWINLIVGAVVAAWALATIVHKA
jgi:hypothetical protein